MMECPYCGAELEYHDIYGRLLRYQDGEVLGEIYRCPNREGFETEEEARNYAPDSEEPWEEICCDSNMHNVCGSFYTDKNGTLHEGYPC